MSSPNLIVFTIILIFGIQAIVLVILILRKRPIKQSNIFLALILFFFALMSVNAALAHFLIVFNKINLYGHLRLQLLFGIGPSLYFYTKSITDPDYHISRKEYIHFIPVVLEFIYLRTPFFQKGYEYRSRFYQKGVYEIPFELHSFVDSIIQNLMALSAIIYISFSIWLFFRYKKWLKSNYSNLKSKSLRWFSIPLFLYSGFWILWMFIRTLDDIFFQNQLQDSYTLPFVIGISVATCWIGFKGYIKAQIDAVGFSKESLNVKLKSANPEVANEIINLMLTQKPYLNPDLDLQKLSEMIDMNSKIVSQIINTDLKMNFYEFINKYRVEEFKNRLQNQESDKFSLMGLAYECGFSSKSTFNHVFKKITGQTPSEYKNQL